MMVNPSSERREMITGVLIVVSMILVLFASAVTERTFHSVEASDQEPRLFFPIVSLRYTPPLAPPIAISTTQTFNVDELTSDLESRGMALSLNKIGFHIAVGGNTNGIGDWWTALNDNKVPVVLKSVGNGGDIAAVQDLEGSSNVPHILVYRTAGHAQDGYSYDVPDYTLSPDKAAELHWQRHKDVLPPEIDYDRAWIETVNELDKNKSDWIGQFAIETAQLILAEFDPAYRWAAFGWSAGEPEPEHWESPNMLQFLQLAGENPDRLAIALHEYSLTVDDIADGYPYKVGRFQTLFEICDKYGIPRPTILITEWGWEHNNVPEPDQALMDIAWAAWLYAAYPQIRGAAIWYLGPDFNNIADKAQRFIEPVTDYSLLNYFEVTPGVGEIDASLFEPPWWK